MNIPEKYCIVDIETYTPTGQPNPKEDEIRYVGFLSCTGSYKIFHISEYDSIQSALDGFDYLVGHNILNYDIPILERHGFYFQRQIFIDTYQIVEKRAKSMMYLDLNRGEKSLKALCKRWELAHQKKEFDYSLLKKKQLEGEEYKQLENYLVGDLHAANELFKYFYEFFYGFKELMNGYDQRKMNWLKCSTGTLAFKIICNLADIPEEYGDYYNKKEVRYSGGFVSKPYNDYFER
jgi:hypothetical protein